jgi:hypothetical protein
MNLVKHTHSTGQACIAVIKQHKGLIADQILSLGSRREASSSTPSTGLPVAGYTNLDSDASWEKGRASNSTTGCMVRMSNMIDWPSRRGGIMWASQRITLLYTYPELNHVQFHRQFLQSNYPGTRANITINQSMNAYKAKYLVTREYTFFVALACLLCNHVQHSHPPASPARVFSAFQLVAQSSGPLWTAKTRTKTPGSLPAGIFRLALTFWTGVFGAGFPSRPLAVS